MKRCKCGRPLEDDEPLGDYAMPIPVIWVSKEDLLRPEWPLDRRGVDGDEDDEA